jgi:hypothetical protein
MYSPSSKSFMLFFLLAALMAATRSHHFDALTHLPDASLAVFLLAGFCLPRAAFPALLLVAGLADYAAINVANVSDYCFTPAYWLLIPTYALLWLAGNWYRKSHQATLASLAKFGVISFAAVTGAFVMSNLGFYLFAGYFAQMSASSYAASVGQYYLPYLISAALYLVPACTAYALFIRTTPRTATTQ